MSGRLDGLEIITEKAVRTESYFAWTRPTHQHSFRHLPTDEREQRWLETLADLVHKSRPDIPDSFILETLVHICWMRMPLITATKTISKEWERVNIKSDTIPGSNLF